MERVTSRTVRISLCILFWVLAHSFAEAQPTEPPAAVAEDSAAIPLNTGAVAGATAPESAYGAPGHVNIRNVQRATLTPVLPNNSKATGAAVIVAPGGGFMELSMDGEGWEIAHWLADRGIAAFVLKYRLRPTAESYEEFRKEFIAFITKANIDNLVVDAPQDAIADGQAALRLVRSRAREWNVDPSRVGMLGFSAGAILTLAMTLKATPESMPSFIAPIYGPMGPVAVPAAAPPMFSALATDDPLFANRGFGLIDSWVAAKRPVEFHLYQKGRHGFAIGRPNTTTTDWLNSFVHWLDTDGFLGSHP